MLYLLNIITLPLNSQDFIILLLLFLLILNLLYVFGERRIMVFFIYLELVHVLIILLLLSTNLAGMEILPMYLTIIMFIIGVSGAETAVLLVLFMAYFRVTGQTTFQLYKSKR